MLHKKLGFYGACCAYGALHGYARRSRAPEGDNLYSIAFAKMRYLHFIQKQGIDNGAGRC